MTKTIQHNSAGAKFAFAVLLALFTVIAVFRFGQPKGPAAPGLELKLEQDGLSGLAVFERGKYLWVVLEKNVPFNMENFKKNNEELIEEAVLLPNAQALILRLRPAGGLSPVVRRDNNRWKIGFHHNNLPFARAETPIALRHTQKEEAYLFFPGNSYGKVLNLVDPEIGDNLIILPSYDKASQVNYGYRYPDLDILPSYQGIAVAANRDDLYGQKQNGGVALRAARNGLHIDSDLPRLKRRNLAEQISLYKQPLSEILTNARGEEDFNRTETQLLTAILQSPQDYKTEAELQLAAYYLAMGLPSPAETVLVRVLAAENLPEALAFRLKGISDFMQRRYSDARRNFLFAGGGNTETALWLSIIEVEESPDNPHSVLSEANLAALEDYPLAVRAAAAVAVLPSLIRFGSEDEATRQIVLLRRFPKYRAAADYFTALNNETRGKKYAARAFYQNALAFPDYPYAARSRRRLAVMDAAEPEKLPAENDMPVRRRELLLQAEAYLHQNQRPQAEKKLKEWAAEYKISDKVEKEAAAAHIGYEPLRQLFWQIVESDNRHE